MSSSMKVLIIKTSSMGDVIHTLPALTDAGRMFPNIRFDWVVEEAFAEIPSWHPLVDRVIPVALRRWRKNIWHAFTRGEWRKFYQQLRLDHYDYIIDAQGLIKSAFLTRLARGLRCGLDRQSAWEPLAALCYQRTFNVLPEQHAIMRVRQLFAKTFNYSLNDTVPDYGLNRDQLIKNVADKDYIIFLHGTTWPTKHWPEAYWQALARYVTQAGYKIKLPWGNQIELERAQRIAAISPFIEVLPKLKLVDIASILVAAKAAVAVDTGLGHLAAALRVPTISLYGPTNPQLTGALGIEQTHLSAIFPCAPCLQQHCTYPQPHAVEPPCFGKLPPTRVWEQLQSLISD